MIVEGYMLINVSDEVELPTVIYVGLSLQEALEMQSSLAKRGVETIAFEVKKAPKP